MGGRERLRKGASCERIVKPGVVRWKGNVQIHIIFNGEIMRPAASSRVASTARLDVTFGAQQSLLSRPHGTIITFLILILVQSRST